MACNRPGCTEFGDYDHVHTMLGEATPAGVVEPIARPGSRCVEVKIQARTMNDLPEVLTKVGHLTLPPVIYARQPGDAILEIVVGGDCIFSLRRRVEVKKGES